MTTKTLAKNSHGLTESHVTSASNSGHHVSDTHVATAPLNLTKLQGQMGHNTRMLWDIQKTRISLGNRLGACERDELDLKFIDNVKAFAEAMAKIESQVGRELEKAAAKHPMADWIKDQRGIGLGGFARLLAVSGTLDRFPTVSKLWKYLGLAVIDGKAQKMPKGEIASHTNCAGGTHLRTCTDDCTRDHHPNCKIDGFGTSYSPQGKVVCRQIAEAIVKSGSGTYRDLYDVKKLYYQLNRPDWTPKHRHDAAMRYAVKSLVRDMWVEWHNRNIIGNSTVTSLAA